MVITARESVHEHVRTVDGMSGCLSLICDGVKRVRSTCHVISLGCSGEASVAEGVKKPLTVTAVPGLRYFSLPQPPSAPLG